MSTMISPPAGAIPQADAGTARLNETLAQLAEFAQLSPTPANQSAAALDVFTDVPLTVTARLGQTVLTIGELMKLGSNSTVVLDREVGHPVELIVAGKVFARGDVVVVNDHFAIRISDLAVTRKGNGSNGV